MEWTERPSFSSTRSDLDGASIPSYVPSPPAFPVGSLSIRPSPLSSLASSCRENTAFFFLREQFRANPERTRRRGPREDPTPMDSRTPRSSGIPRRRRVHPRPLRRPTSNRRSPRHRASSSPAISRGETRAGMKCTARLHARALGAARTT